VCCVGGSEDNADWRELVASFKVIQLPRLVKLDPQTLLLMLYDLYASGGDTATDKPNDSWYLTDIEENMRVRTPYRF
jgi:hypothetical protein